MVFEKIINSKDSKLAVLIDPDKQLSGDLLPIIRYSVSSRVDFFFIGGSLLVEKNFEATIEMIKMHCSIPVIIFPGSNYQLSKKADAVLFSPNENFQPS